MGRLYTLFQKINRRVRRFTVVTSDPRCLSAEQLKEFALTSPMEADILWNARNVVWQTRRDGHTIVVKTFCGSILSSIIYIFRKSKAHRSYEHAVELLRRGIPTPQPLGFVEERGLFNILSLSCYASASTSYEPLSDVMERDYKPVLAAFAQFVASLHRAGVRHDDLNCSNVRVGRDRDGNFVFCLIDLNRMKILPPGKRLSRKEAYINAGRFTYDHDKFRYFASEYVRAAGLPQKCVYDMVKTKEDFERVFWRRKKVLHAIRDFFLFRR